MGARTARGERGTTVVEFALVFPMVLALVLGIVQYGYQYWALETAAASAREAARDLIVGVDQRCVLERAREHADGPNVARDDPRVEVRYANATNTPERGVLVTVTVSFQSLDVGLLPVPADGWVVESATNRVENVPEDPLACLDP